MGMVFLLWLVEFGHLLLDKVYYTAAPYLTKLLAFLNRLYRWIAICLVSALFCILTFVERLFQFDRRLRDEGRLVQEKGERKRAG